MASRVAAAVFRISELLRGTTHGTDILRLAARPCHLNRSHHSAAVYQQVASRKLDAAYCSPPMHHTSSLRVSLYRLQGLTRWWKYHNREMCRFTTRLRAIRALRSASRLGQVAPLLQRLDPL